LELAAWTVLEEPLVYCLIRNPTDEPVSLPGGRIGIGFPGMSVVRARPVGISQWTKIPWDIGPTNFPNNLGCLVPALLEPGSELPNTDRHFDDHEILNLPGWTFSVWLSGYDFPVDWSGVVDVRIDCLVHQFPSVQLPLEVIRLGRAAHFARRDAWLASQKAK